MPVYDSFQNLANSADENINFHILEIRLFKPSSLSLALKTPLPFFHTTAIVQDNKLVSLKNYVNARTNTAKKVLNTILL